MWLKRCVTSLVVIAYIAISLLLLAFETAPYMRLYQQKTTLHQGMRSPTLIGWYMGCVNIATVYVIYHDTCVCVIYYFFIYFILDVCAF